MIIGNTLPAAEIEYLPFTRASAISGDGTTVVGHVIEASSGLGTAQGAIRWTPESGAVSLSTGLANDVSLDGSAVVGLFREDFGPGVHTHSEAFRWTEESGVELLGFLPGTEINAGGASHARFVSAGGLVVAGTNRRHARNPFGNEAFRWTEEAGIQGIGTLPGYAESSIQGLSADGSVLVGISSLEDGSREHQAFRWTEDVGMLGLGFFPEHGAVELVGYLRTAPSS